MGNILILTPRLHTLTGNLVTASRMADNLRCLGQHTIVMEVGTEDIEIGHVKLVMCEHEVDKVVFLHAHKTGHLLLKLQHWAEDHARTVVVLTGSDIHGECMFETLETLMAADAIVSQNRLTVVRLNSSNYTWGKKVSWLPQGLDVRYVSECQSWPYKYLKQGEYVDYRRILVPASIRRVKNLLQLAYWFGKLEGQVNWKFKVGFCGAMLDHNYESELKTMCATNDSCGYLGYIKESEMRSAMEQSDLVVNNSNHEGLCQSLVESYLAGTHILARDHEGNNGLKGQLPHGVMDTFKDFNEFKAQFTTLLSEEGLDSGFKPNPTLFDSTVEAESLLALFSSIPEPA